MDHGLNWIRVYVGLINGEINAAELLIKNHPVPEFLEYIRGKPFAKANGFYSYRNFMIIREDVDANKITGGMPLDELILELLRMADENPRIEETEFFNYLALHSDDPQGAMFGYGFFQVGFFRRVKCKLGEPFSEEVHLSEDYYIADADGTIIETGKLIDQEWHKAAFSVPEYCITSNNVMAIAMTFSEAQVIYNTFKKGQKLEGAIIGPMIRFTSTPTEKGEAKVISLVGRQLDGQKKPWWKIW